MQNRNKAKKIIKDVLTTINNESFTPIQNDFFSNPGSLENEDISSEQLKVEIYNHIIQLRIMIDFKHKIKSKLITLDDSRKVYVRYCELGVMLNPQEKEIAVYNYLRIFYAYLLAAIAIARINNFDNVDFAKQINFVKKITTDIFYSNLSTADNDVMFRYVTEGKGDLIKLMHMSHSKMNCRTFNLHKAHPSIHTHDQHIIAKTLPFLSWSQSLN